ncbi:alpha/beta hydrolase [Salipiger mangrovisoli]|uniref:Alpha/beta hydrolase n=1 Tax=Salipiger mangrovisoli TaxID=2865933 RepID=A0ABR9X3C4_9RHOB|nr:alpha/beta hydrolase [Salipiger mangrovisoli]MBE9637953.1 alpha/beta hydrolase [Salipiger mangrovisoli]
MTQTLSYHARTRSPDPGAPLIFAFHGTGGDENQFFELVRQIHPGAGIVSPRGDVSEGGAARFFRRTGEGVYDMDDLARRTERMAAFVAAHKEANPGVPVYGFGYSNGANILASVVMAHPELFDRIGLLHPLVPWEPAPVDLGGRHVLITAGHRDPICPWGLSDRLVRWFGAQGAELRTETHDGGHEIRQGELSALADLLTG